MVLRIGVVGATGRMGRTLVRTVLETEGCELAGAITREDCPNVGQDAAVLAGLPPFGVIVGTDAETLFQSADAVLDFTQPEASILYANLAAQYKVAHIIGTTGFNEIQLKDIACYSERTAIVRSGNMSLGVNLLAALTEKVAATLDIDFDIEILEMHHRHKVDAPSGTALLLGEAAAKGRGIDLKTQSVRTRDGYTGERPEGTIGFATLRGGSVVGEHTVMFAGPSERIELRHSAEDRSIFARGAVKAAQWAASQEAGLYSMRDVLGL